MEKEHTHFLLTKEVMQNIFDYFAEQPTKEVLPLIDKLRADAQPVNVNILPNENKDQETTS